MLLFLVVAIVLAVDVDATAAVDDGGVFAIVVNSDITTCSVK